MVNSKSYPVVLDTSVNTGLFRDFRYQILLGWEYLLHEFIISGIVEHQQRQYKEKKISKTRNRWRMQLIIWLLKIIQKRWIHRNSVLHETEAIARQTGLEELKTGIYEEYELGLDELSSIYTSYFLPPTTFILRTPIAYIRRWFFSN